MLLCSCYIFTFYHHHHVYITTIIYVNTTTECYLYIELQFAFVTSNKNTVVCKHYSEMSHICIAVSRYIGYPMAFKVLFSSILLKKTSSFFLTSQCISHRYTYRCYSSWRESILGWEILRRISEILSASFGI
jgi:hypothetical protein